MINHIRNPALAFLAILSISFVLVCFAFATPAGATQTVPYKMNFQGRLTTSAGVPKADGTYNMKFRIYDASTNGNLVWSEERAVSASTGVALVGGLFSTQLGDVTGLTPSVFTNPDLYFEIELPTPATATCATAACAVYSEGAMTPRNKLASAAYAFNADTVDGIDGANLGQLNGSNVWTGTNQVVLTSTTAFQIQKAAGSDTIMTADTTNNRLVVGNSTSAANADVTLFVVDGSTSTYTPTGVAGGMFYDTTNNKFKCYTTSWVDCDTTGGGGSSSKTVTLVPEYAGGVLKADGTNNNGTMTTDFVLGAGYMHNYYEWSSSQATAQDYDIIVRHQLPSDVNATTEFDANSWKIWTYVDNNANSTIAMTVYDSDGTVCASAVDIEDASTGWAQKTLTDFDTNTDCNFTANSMIAIKISMSGLTPSTNKVRVAEIEYGYTN